MRHKSVSKKLGQMHDRGRKHKKKKKKKKIKLRNKNKSKSKMIEKLYA